MLPTLSLLPRMHSIHTKGVVVVVIVMIIVVVIIIRRRATTIIMIVFLERLSL